MVDSRGGRRLMLVSVLFWAPNLIADDERDVVFDCPCSAEWIPDAAGDESGWGTLTLSAGIRSYRATRTGAIWIGSGLFVVHTNEFLYSASVGQLSGRQRVDIELSFRWYRYGEGDISLDLHERLARGSDGRSEWHHHESLTLFREPYDQDEPTTRFVDILTDSDGDGVGDVNERLAGTPWQDATAIPDGHSEVDVLALYSHEFAVAEGGAPYTRILHLLTVADAIFTDSDTNLRLRLVGMSVIEQDENGYDAVEGRHDELMELHGADVSYLFSPVVPCPRAGCGRLGFFRGQPRPGGRAWQIPQVGATVTAHELGHVFGLAHSARQGEADGAWRWSRGHYLSPRGNAYRRGTIMAYGHDVLGVFSNPSVDCGAEPCGVASTAYDGADAVQSLDLLRFRIAAVRPPAPDTDGDGFVDAADAFPHDPGEWFDVDGDGIGDNADPDNDNDGTPDAADPFPLDPNEWADADHDGIGDNADDDVVELDSPFRDPALHAAVAEALGKTSSESITPKEVASLEELDGRGRDIQNVTGLDEGTALSSLHLGNNHISDVGPLAELGNLRHLYLHGNAVRDVAPLADLTGLRTLFLGHNLIDDISPLSMLAAITHLGVASTAVALEDVLALPYATGLTRLDLGRLRISDISDLSALGDLESLRLDGNAVVDLGPLAGLTRLRLLNFSDNAVSDITALTELTALEDLFLNRNTVADLAPLASLTDLWQLQLGGNTVVDLAPLANLTDLFHLRLSDNAVSDITALTGLTALRHLRLDGNSVSDITALTHLTALRALDLAGNNVVDLAPLAGLTGLDRLDLSDNAVADIGPLVDRAIFGGDESEGAELNLSGNPLGRLSVDEHIPTLRSWGVEVDFDPTPRFVDPTLRDLVANRVALSERHVDDTLDTEVVAGLWELRFAGRGVQSLVGLDAAASLKRLYGAGNRIADLSPLAALGELDQLDLRDNRIVDVKPLVANAALGEGDWVALDGNPLSEESLNVHIPALLARGVAVSVGTVNLTLVAGGPARRFDVGGYFDAVIGLGANLSASVDDTAVATATVDGAVLVVRPGGSGGIAQVSLTARDARSGASESLVFVVTVRKPWAVPLVVSATPGVRQGFVRLLNHGSKAAVARIAAIDDAGIRHGPWSLTIGAGKARQLNANDFESGNSDKGLPGVGQPTGHWRLEVASTGALETTAYLSVAGGFVTAMHDLVPASGSVGNEWIVPTFNPASNLDQASSLRLTNQGNGPAWATITGVDHRGRSPGPGVRVEIGAGKTVTLTASELESGPPQGQGRIGDGDGQWRLRVASAEALSVMNLIGSPQGHWANLSTHPVPALSEDGVHTVPLFPSASDASRRQGVVRVVNRSDEAGQVHVVAYDDHGNRRDGLTLAIAADRTKALDSLDLEAGNARKGLVGSTGPGTGDWWLEMRSDLDIHVLAYIRTSGFSMAMHDVVPNQGRRYDVATFYPAGNRNQAGLLRIVNPGSRPAHVAVAGIDDAGMSPGDVARLSVAPRSARTLSSTQLEEGAAGVVGRLGDGRGRWRLLIDSEQPILVLNLLASRTGHLSNLSTSGVGDRGAHTGADRVANVKEQTSAEGASE